MKDRPGITYSISRIEQKETSHGAGDAIIYVRCSAKGVPPDFFYFLEIQKNIEIVQKAADRERQQNFMRGVCSSSGDSPSVRVDTATMPASPEDEASPMPKENLTTEPSRSGATETHITEKETEFLVDTTQELAAGDELLNDEKNQDEAKKASIDETKIMVQNTAVLLKSPQADVEFWEKVEVGVEIQVNAWSSIPAKVAGQAPEHVTLVRIQDSQGVKGYRKCLPDGSYIEHWDNDSQNNVAENNELYERVPVSSVDLVVRAQPVLTPAHQLQDSNKDVIVLESSPSLQNPAPQFVFNFCNLNSNSCIYLGNQEFRNTYQGYGSSISRQRLLRCIEGNDNRSGHAFYHESTPYLNRAGMKAMGEPNSKTIGVLADGSPDPRSVWLVPRNRINLSGGFAQMKDDFTAFIALAHFSTDAVASMHASQESRTSVRRHSLKGLTVEMNSLRCTPGGEIIAVGPLAVLPSGSKSDINSAFKSVGGSTYVIAAQVGEMDANGMPTLFPDLEERTDFSVVMIPHSSIIFRGNESIFRIDHNEESTEFSSAYLPQLSSEVQKVVTNSIQSFMTSGEINESTFFCYPGNGKGRASRQVFRYHPPASAAIVIKDAMSILPKPSSPSSAGEIGGETKSKKKRRKSKGLVESEVISASPSIAMPPSAVLPVLAPSFLHQVGEVMSKAASQISDALREKSTQIAQSSSSSFDAALTANENAIKVARLEVELKSVKEMSALEARLRQEHGKQTQELHRETNQVYEARLHDMAVSNDKVAAVHSAMTDVIFKQQEISQRQYTEMLHGSGDPYRHNFGRAFAPFFSSTSPTDPYSKRLRVDVPGGRMMVDGQKASLMLEGGPPETSVMPVAPSLDDSLAQIQQLLKENHDLLQSGVIDESDYEIIKANAFARFKSILQMPAFNLTNVLTKASEWKKSEYITDIDFKELKKEAIHTTAKN